MNLRRKIEEELKVNQRHQKWYSNIQYPLKTLPMFHAYPNFSSTPYEKRKLDRLIKRTEEKKKVIEKFAVLISTCRRIELLFGRNKGIPNNFASRSDTFNREIFSCPGAKGGFALSQDNLCARPFLALLPTLSSPKEFTGN